MRKLVVLLLLVGLVGGGAWAATQPASGLPAVQVSSDAAFAAKAKVAAAFARAAVAAFIKRKPQPIRVQLSDQEITSLAAEKLSGADSQISNPVIHGTSNGVFEAGADAPWNGVTLHVSGTGSVTIDQNGALHAVIKSADVGALPLPASVVQSLADQATSTGSVPVPPGVSDLALQPVDGGAVLTGTATAS